MEIWELLEAKIRGQEIRIEERIELLKMLKRDLEESTSLVVEHRDELKGELDRCVSKIQEELFS